jgi:hypothetical protein
VEDLLEILKRTHRKRGSELTRDEWDKGDFIPWG